ncbi:branched-chain amino acid ABC transporter permease [Roseobacter denitrificans]|uniref:Branched-chain amino acid ABC transporter, permease protein, putative n=1 Tax=Roseobacter denitrificans (strain ATCC 33942 / OCh 114) TaxID=375451 RepID=Q162M4_ROSDO|nr:branched-chain amino acid ABC transporter permease [Roseobacter denitrificans]ABG33069.1 branched-chain amino acid ABC transporter, permease protein, putative [Roseobacter denitrificans OCh 114]AVL52441.1 branched-chain amino acid ABC transporter permease [Roseobacter denitrificans]SFG08504.1 amino acid/amide ABC transporter membrane protein 2, HAAT family [Roseobacter denitrificans OCh 114]
MAQTHKQKRLSAWSTPILLIAILAVFTLLVTLLGDNSLARMAAQTLIRVTFVVGLWIFVGNSGIVSFGHAGYMAVGAYCSAWLTLRPQMKGMFLPDLWPFLATAEWSVFPAAVVSGLLAAFIALLSGAAILRLSGIAASIATFAFLAIVYTVYSSWEGVTGATSSVVGLTRYADQWVTLGWASATILAAAWYANSASGLALRASREDEVAADASGINMYRHRLIALVVSAFFAGVAGALFGHSLGVLNPNSFYLGVTFITLAMLVVGGIGSLTGAVMGVLVLSIIIEALVRMERGMEIGEATFALPTGAQEIIIGVIMILVLILRPTGLTGGRELRLRIGGR